MQETRRIHTLAPAVAMVGALCCGPAPAEDGQRIEVTGSAIKRLATQGALPVQSFNQADIQRSGAASVADFLQQLPAMQHFTVAADSVGGTGGGLTTVSLHDLGEQYTLVLLNGRRVAPATSGTTIDLHTLPLNAVERIEVLSDGASALYGADAIGGVVNIVLKKGAAPFEISARLIQPQHPGGRGRSVSLSKGVGDLERDGFSLFGAVGLERRSAIQATDRSFAKTGIIRFKDQQGRQLSFFNGSSRSVPPNVDVAYLDPTEVTPTNPTGLTSDSFSPYREAQGACPSDQVESGRQCFFDYTSTIQIEPEQERRSLYGTGELKLGASGFKAFADVALLSAGMLTRTAPYPAEFSLDAAHPYFTRYVDPYLTPLQRSTLQSTVVKYRLYDLGNRVDDHQTQASHVVLGIDGMLGAWDVNSALTYSSREQRLDYRGGYPLAQPFEAATAEQRVDPFPYLRGTMPPDQLAALRATQFFGNYATTDIRLLGVDARASRPLFALSGGQAELGLGVDARQTRYRLQPNAAVANAEILFDSPQAAYDLQRTNLGAFAELLLPLTRQLEVTGGTRLDSISGVEDRLRHQRIGKTQDAATFKLSGKFLAADGVLVRGSVGSGFRTASMLEIAQSQAEFGVSSGSYVCPFNSGFDPKGLARYCWSGENQVEEFSGGNPDLKPERSRQWTLGLVLEPGPRTSVALDWWSVRITDAVSAVSERLILSDPAKYLDLYTTKFKASTGREDIAIVLAPINIGRIENQGLDWSLMHVEPTRWGRFTGRVAGTYLVKSRYTMPGTDDSWQSSLNRFGSNDAVSFRHQIAASGTLEQGAWSHTLQLRYRNGYKDIHRDAETCAVDDGVDCVDTQLRVPSYATFDWQTRWAASDHLALTLGIVNLADKKPPLSLRDTGSHQLGYDSRYASPVGRSFTAGATLRF